MDWYEKIEPEVREIVRELRNKGINTICSCGHKMEIQGDSDDIAEDEKVISNIMLERDLEFELVFVRTIRKFANYRRFYLKINPTTDELQCMKNNLQTTILKVEGVR